uniref:agrin isoform X2 n=1 Tax=Myxine glutinosa TaxID=7769 RepID=UPI00358F0C2B
MPRPPLVSLILAAALALGTTDAACRDEPLESRESDAPIVLTGTVEKVQKHGLGSERFSCTVRVWRCLKGEGFLKGTEAPDRRRIITVEGFGEPDICDSTVVLGDTRIFLLRPQPAPRTFRLTSSPLRVTLKNLKRVENAVEDHPLLAAHPVSTSLNGCRHVLCGFGAVCENNPLNWAQRGRCVCKTPACPPQVAPVCGSDRVTYSSACELERAQCRLQRRILVLAYTACGFRDPCKNTTCSFGSICISSSDRLSAKCVCPRSCVRSPPGTTPVCGSDGRDYASECELNLYSCSQHVNVQKKFNGPCDPCAPWRSDVGHSCRVDPLLRSPQLTPLPDSCPPASGPVCGDDGHTYASECALVRTAEARGVPIARLHAGTCTFQDECRSDCTYNSECVVRNGVPRCSCERLVCDGAYTPFCGTDRTTYNNECGRRRAECLQRRIISVAAKGPCDLSVPGPCRGVNCGLGAVCTVQNGAPTCECPHVCSDIPFAAVCGTDGRTYASLCHLRAAACAMRMDIRMARSGECDRCAHCKFGAVCNEGTGRCMCPDQCVETKVPMCGTNGLTYKSECALHIQACLEQKNLYVLSSGKCECDRSQGLASYNPCQEKRCKLFGGEWEMASQGTDGHCTCLQDCRFSPTDPLCGSDGRTYMHDCARRKTACKQQHDITLTHKGSCTTDKSVDCWNTIFGCCPDNVTGASGVAFSGCPGTYNCNPVGSYGLTSEPGCTQCPCRPGVEGTKCDKCMAGFWDFLGITWKKNPGCTPCLCHPGGSARDDCLQETGQCTCKTGILGAKCDQCPTGEMFGPNGCKKAEPPKTCWGVTCKHGASCVQKNGQASCECLLSCSLKSPHPVCGADNVTYADECQLRLIACRQGRDLLWKDGHCPGVLPPVDINPITLHHWPPSKTLPSTWNKPGVDGVVKPEHSVDINKRHPSQPPVVNPWPSWPTMASPSVTEDGKNEGSGSGNSGIFSSVDLNPFALLKWPTATHVPILRRQGSVFAVQPPRPDSPASPPSEKPLALFEKPLRIFLPKSPIIAGRPTPPPDLITPAPFWRIHGSGTLQPALLPDAEDTDDGWSSGNFFNDEEVKDVFLKTSCDNTWYGCCPDGIMAASTANYSNCPATRVFLGIIVLAGPYVSEGTAFVQETSEHNAEIMTALGSLLHKLLASSDVGDDFRTVHVKEQGNNRVTIETHFDPKTQYTPVDVERALVSRLKTSREKTLDVKKPEENYIEFMELKSQGTEAIADASSEDPCLKNPCLHGGTCHPSSSSYLCCCPLGRGGSVCEREIRVSQPAFGGVASFLAFPLGRMSLFQRTRLALRFRASAPDGLLVYIGHSKAPDFISLALVGGHVELRFDAGSGQAVLTSKREVKPGTWHQVWVERSRHEASLSVDKEPAVSASSPGPLNGLNLDTDVFLGGSSSDLMPRVVEQTTAAKGLMGCINYLSLNGVVFSLSWPPDEGTRSLSTSRRVPLYGACVGECQADPCRPRPCQHGGFCQVLEADSFRCSCPVGYSGPTCADVANPCQPSPCHNLSHCLRQTNGGFRCECPFGREGTYCEREMADVSDTVFIPAFNGLTSYIETRSLKQLAHNAKNHLTIEVVFFSRRPNGLVFYNGQKSSGRGDFISLALAFGYLEFRYNLGKGTAVLRSPKTVSLNEWHTVVVSRTGRKGFMRIDGGAEILGDSPANHMSLDLRESLYLGGVPDYSKIASAAAVTDGLDGAIQKLSVDASEVKFHGGGVRDAGDIHPFIHHVCIRRGNPCKNSGTCRPRMAYFTCDCRPGFHGRICETAVIDRMALHHHDTFALDGQTFLEYQSSVRSNTNSTPSQLANLIELTIRTEVTQGLLIWLGHVPRKPRGAVGAWTSESDGDYLALAIVDSRVQMTFNLGVRPVTLTSTVKMNTNQWVHIKARRIQREASLQVDNEAPVTASSPFGSTNLDVDGRMWLGGLPKPPTTNRLPKAYGTRFVGCMRDIRVDRKVLRAEDATNKPRVQECLM